MSPRVGRTGNDVIDMEKAALSGEETQTALCIRTPRRPLPVTLPRPHSTEEKSATSPTTCLQRVGSSRLGLQLVGPQALLTPQPHTCLSRAEENVSKPRCSTTHHAQARLTTFQPQETPGTQLTM